MLYREKMIEIQYRECQVLRDAIAYTKEQTMATLDFISRAQPLKAEYCYELNRFIRVMDDKYWAALMEFAQYLKKKETGIDILVPFYAKNGLAIMPVNCHVIHREEKGSAD